MRKQFIFIVFVLISSLFVFGKSINVTNPNGSSQISAGDMVRITWQKQGQMKDFVKIRVFDRNGSRKIIDIVNRTPNKGLFKWKFNGSLADGSYTIMVKTVDNKVFGLSPIFTIGKKGSPPPPPPNTSKLSVTFPNGGESLSKDYNNKITWDATNIVGNIRIELWKGSRKYGTIVDNFPVIKKGFNWKTGTTFGNLTAGAGSDYRIKIYGSGLEDMSDRYFSISDIPGIISNNNNIINNVHTFKNPPQEQLHLAIPPKILEIKVWSNDQKYRGQVRSGEVFDVKIQLKNTSNQVDRTDWKVAALLNNAHEQSQIMYNSRSPKQPGQTWWFTMKTLLSSYLPNKSGFHVLKIKIGENKKSTMIGIIQVNNPVYPIIKRCSIYDPVSGSYKKSGKYKKGDEVDIAYNVTNVKQLTFRNMSSNKVVKTISLPHNFGEGYARFKCEVSGYIKMTAISNSGNYKEAKVYLDTTGPLKIGGNYLDFDMWRSGRNIKTRGMVQNYRSVTLVEILDTGKEVSYKKITVNTPKSARLDWDVGPLAFPVKLRLRVVFLDYSKRDIVRSFK